MPRIYITEPNHFYTYELPTAPGAEVLIGTAPHCQLALPGVAGLGEVHACISCQPQGYVIADLGSPTGTFANGVPIRSEYLMAGVEYRLGAAVITLEAAVPQPQPGMPPMQQPVPQAAPVASQPVPQAAAPGAQPAAQKKASPLKTSTSQGGAPKLKAGKGAGKAGKTDLTSMAAKFDRSRGKGASQATFIYVVVMLVIAFYAGIALHHWERTGNCLPGLVADEQDPPAAVVASPAPAQTEAAGDSEAVPPAAEEDTTPAAADDSPEVGDDSSADAEPAADNSADDTPPADAEPDNTEPIDDEPATEEPELPEEPTDAETEE